MTIKLDSRSLARFLLVATLLALPVSAKADIISLTPADIHGGDSSTSFYSDAFVTLTPLQGTTQATFNGGTAESNVRLGIDDFGTNANAFNDPDTNPNNGNEERLEFDFVDNAGLTTISYDFSRADGTGDLDGVVISGFLFNPNVSFSIDNPNLFSVYDAVNGSVRLNIPGSLFNGTDVDINFNPVASNGSLLSLSVTDTTQAGAQLAITQIAYENDVSSVPEPASFTMMGLAGLCIAHRRRRV